MPSDTEPRYRLVDSNGNVVGSLYAEADGTLKLQEGTSGSDNEVSVATDGTFSAPAVSTAILNNITDAGIVNADNAPSITIIEDSFVTVSGNATQEIVSFSASNAVDIVSGHISGYAAKPVTVTFADGSTFDVTNERAAGQDSGSNNYQQTTPLPPLADVTDLEFANDTSTERDYAWSILTL